MEGKTKRYISGRKRGRKVSELLKIFDDEGTDKKQKLIINKMPLRYGQYYGNQQQKRKRRSKYKKRKPSKFYKRVKAIASYSTPTTIRTLTRENPYQITPAINKSETIYISILDKSHADDILQNYQYIADPSTGTVSTVDLTGTTNLGTHFKFRDFMSRMFLRNNGDLAAYVNIYKVAQKRSGPTAIAPQQAWQNGIGNISTGTNATGITDILVNPTDSREFNQYYKILKKETLFLAAGESCYRTFKHKAWFSFESKAMYDDMTDYVKGLTYWWIVKAYGDVAHDDTTTSTVGMADPTIDVVVMDKVNCAVSDVMIPRTRLQTSDLATMSAGAVQFTNTMEEAKGDK